MRILAIAVLLQAAVAAAGTWSTTIHLDDPQGLYGLWDGITLRDGSSILAFSGAFENPVLVCMDPGGGLLWFGHVLEATGTARELEDTGGLTAAGDGFAACFFSQPRATGIDTDVAVARMSVSGDVLWTYVLGESDQSNWAASDIITCSDGGLLVTGCPGTQLPAGFVLKLSADGRREWMTDIDEEDGYAISSLETGDEGFLVLLADVYDGCSTLLPVDSDGRSSDPFTVDDTEYCFQGRIRTDGERYWVILPRTGGSLMAATLDEDYRISTELEIDLPPDQTVSSVEVLTDGLLLAGQSGNGRALLSKYTFDGSLIWERRYDPGSECELSCVYVDQDGILAFGSVRDSGYLVLRTDSEGLLDDTPDDGKGRLLLEPSSLDISCESLGWLAACAVLPSREEAGTAAAEVTTVTGLESGTLWIPDWQSLSGAEGWLVYANTWMAGEGTLDEGLEALTILYPDTYFVWVSQGMTRESMSVEGYRELFSVYW